MSTAIDDYYKQMYSPNRPFNTGTRIAAMLLDHIFMTAIVMLVAVPVVILSMASELSDNPEATGLRFLDGPAGYIILAAFSLYFCKDIFNGRSIAKRILKLQVVDHRTGLAASPLQCLVRDLFCILWMIEAIVAIANPSRRIGDHVAGTRLVYYDSSATPAPPPAWQWPAALLLSFGMVALAAFTLPDIPNNHVEITDNRPVNQAATEALSRLLTDSLGTALQPDVKVYEPVSKTELPYVSILLTYPSPPDFKSKSHQQLSARVIRLVYSQLPVDSFSGLITYSYKNKYNSNRSFEYIGSRSIAQPQP